MSRVCGWVPVYSAPSIAAKLRRRRFPVAEEVIALASVGTEYSKARVLSADGMTSESQRKQTTATVGGDVPFFNPRGRTAVSAVDNSLTTENTEARRARLSVPFSFRPVHDHSVVKII